MNTIEIVPKQDVKSGKISTGANSIVLLDGKQLGGCHRITIDIQARGVAKVNIEMFAMVKAKVASKLKKTKKESTGLKTHKGNVLSVYTLSNYSPKELVRKKK